MSVPASHYLLNELRIDLQSLSLNSEKASEESPWVPVVITGDWKGHPDGRQVVTKADLESILQNFNEQKKNGIDLVIDYEHASLFTFYAPAAGWITEMKLEGEKLFVKIKWTPKALEHIKNDEYRYLSPVIQWYSQHKKEGFETGTKLHSVALTNKPFMEELDAIKANNEKLIQPQTKENSDMPNDNDSAQELEALKTENADLKQQLGDQAKANAEAQVDAAIKAGAFSEDQRAAMTTLAIANMGAFSEMVKNHKPAHVLPQNDQYSTNSDHGGSGEYTLSDAELQA